MIKIVDLQNINFVDHTSQCMKMQPAMLQKQTCIAEFFFSLFSLICYASQGSSNYRFFPSVTEEFYWNISRPCGGFIQIYTQVRCT